MIVESRLHAPSLSLITLLHELLEHIGLLLSTCSSHFRFRMISDEGQYASFFTLMHKWIQKETDEMPL